MKFLLLSIVSFCILSGATGLSCYTCMSSIDNCKENLVECNALSATTGLTQALIYKPSLTVLPSSSFKCYKLVVEPVSIDQDVTVKGCTYDTTDVCAGSPVLAEQKHCSTCTENECNGAFQQLGSAGLGLLVAVALTLWRGYYKQ